MKYFLGATALFAATVSADLCSEGTTDDGGNWYCQAVQAITYTGVGSTGSYNKVTNMDSTAGTCSSSAFGYSGSMSPFDEEVSLHFRGPLNLKQFAVYTPGSGSSKARRGDAPERRHAHGHSHQHLHHAREAAAVEERAVGDTVIATIDGQVVSWINQYSGESTAAAPAPAAPTAAAAAAAPAAGSGSGAASSQQASSGSSSSSSSTSSGSGSASGSWSRQAYYNSAEGTADGLVFLNHEGGSGSGVFDYTFGNSLSYASADGASGASSPQTLADQTLTSSDEVVIMSDEVCNGDCGYVRPGTVAHHGFEGASKAFFFEFGMPSDGQTGNSEYQAINMPAIWLLNAQIPRTLQYGNPDCSCWKSGCGEFDIFEVLAAGDSRCKSTLHGNQAGGNSDYFDRPFTGTIKAALVLLNNNLHIKILDNDTEFDSSVAADTINDIAQSTSTQGNGVSLFALAGALAG